METSFQKKFRSEETSMTRKTNKIQVFGLPSSGTNFIEWTLNNNFVDINYQNLYTTQGALLYRSTNPNYSLSSGTHSRPISVKHDFPTLDYSPFAIIIYKTYSVWQDSFMKRKIDVPAFFVERSLYDEYLQKAFELPSEKTIIIEHYWAVKNYFILLDMIADKFNVKKIQNPRQPVNRLAGAGANAIEIENDPFLKNFERKIGQY